jgi:hypothetical protein
MTIDKLTALLKNTSIGLVSAETQAEVLKLLEGCFTEFAGSTESKMEHWKIVREGATDMTWNPPVLTFVIERHGATVLGSTRAEKQQWELNFEKKTADHCPVGYRQLYPTARRVNVKLFAAQVYDAVRQGRDSNSDLILKGILVWQNDDTILVQHGMLIPNVGYPRTISGRRKRFRAGLECLMATIGWELVSVGRWLTFKRCEAPLSCFTSATSAAIESR